MVPYACQCICQRIDSHFISPNLKLPEPHLQCLVLEASPANIHSVFLDYSRSSIAYPAPFFCLLLPCFLSLICLHFTTTPNFCFINSIASCFETLCLSGIFVFFSFLLFTLNPGLLRLTRTSNPLMPSLGSYFVFGRSMYSPIPNPKFPFLSKLFSLSVLSFACSAFFRKSSALFFLIVTFVPIVSPSLNPQVGCLTRETVFIGLAPVIFSIIIIAFSSSSPVCPTPMLTVTFSIWTSLIEFIFQHLQILIAGSFSPTIRTYFPRVLKLISPFFSSTSSGLRAVPGVISSTAAISPMCVPPITYAICPFFMVIWETTFFSGSEILTESPTLRPVLSSVKIKPSAVFSLIFPPFILPFPTIL